MKSLTLIHFAAASFFLSSLTLPTRAHAEAMPSLSDALDDTALPPRLPGPDSVVFSDEILIDSSPAVIWDIMVDLSHYSDWNPWVYQAEAEGPIEPGTVAHVKVKLNGLPFSAKHVVLTATPYESFCWRDAGWNAAFVYGQRCRTLSVQPDGQVLVKVDLLIDGKLSGVSAKLQGSSLKAGMHSELAALKTHAEASK